jgi:hypothetical protein
LKVIEDNLWLCSDCTQVACNGPHGVQLENEKDTLDGLANLGPHLVPDFDSETGDGIEEFSRRICESCNTTLAGYKARFAQLGE